MFEDPYTEITARDIKSLKDYCKMNSKNKAKFIVIEGPDRVGKATQTKLLNDFLLESGYKSSAFEVPIKSNFIYQIIYWMLGNGLAKKFTKTFQWLQYFNRQIFQWFFLPQLEKKLDFIVMDRWSLSTVVYGKATNVPHEFTTRLYDRLKKPDLTVILLGPAYKHEAEDVYEADEHLQSSVRQIYYEWSVQNPQGVLLLDCTQPKQVILQKILDSLK